MEEIEITDIIDLSNSRPEVPLDKNNESSGIVQLPPDASDANFENMNDAISIADPQEKGVPESQERKNTKKKTWAVALVASIAILAGVVGLGAGLGTKKNGNVSAANGVVTLEDCLQLEEDRAIDEFDDSSVNGVPQHKRDHGGLKAAHRAHGRLGAHRQKYPPTPTEPPIDDRPPS